jgi:hypothetical protein
VCLTKAAQRRVGGFGVLAARDNVVCGGSKMGDSSVAAVILMNLVACSF